MLHVMTDIPLAMLQEMNANIPITFVVVTKRQCAIARCVSSETDSFSAMSSSYPPILVTEIGQVMHPLELLSTPQLWHQIVLTSISLVRDGQPLTLHLK